MKLEKKTFHKFLDFKIELILIELNIMRCYFYVTRNLP